MDTAKKAVLEQRIILALGAVFVLSLFMGPARGLLRKRASLPAPQPAVGKVALNKSFGAVMEGGLWQQDVPPQMDVKAQLASSALRVEVPPPAYTAHDVRDPLKSLLPEPQAASGSAEGSGPGQPETAARPAPAPPPDLRVEGLLWGGDKPAAVIDGEVYGVNDVVKGAQIVSIDRRGVTVEYDGQPVFYPPSSTAATGRQSQRPRPQAHRQQVKPWR